MNPDKFHLRSETNISFENIIEILKPEIIGIGQKKFTGISLDSRNVRKGDIFFAIKGESSDGHKYIKNSIENGASSVFLEYIPDNLDLSKIKGISLFKVRNTLAALEILSAKVLEKSLLKNIVISGSVGKTTARKMAVSIFEVSHKVLSNYKNYNNFTGLPLTLLRANKNYEFGIFEIGINQPGEMEKLTRLVKSELAVLLNVRPVHMEFFKSLEHLRDEKMKIIGDGAKTLIFNNDDRLLSKNPRNPKVKYFTFGIETESNISADNINKTEDGKHIFVLKTPDYKIDISLNVLGRHNIYNALAAASMAYFYNIERNDIKRGLEEFIPEDMRCSILKLKNGVTIINDCYNAGPDSMKAALDILNQFKNCNRRIAVLSDMLELGKDEDKYHRKIGNYLNDLNIDLLFSYGERAKKYKDGVSDKNKVKWYSDKNLLFIDMVKMLENKDCILIKGSRGMKMEVVTNMLMEKYGVDNG